MTRAALALLLAGAVAAACAPMDDTESLDSAVTESDDVFGDDRVADALKGKLEALPADYAAAEQLFGIGRACARTDSKEIFVVEEAQTRLNGEASHTQEILPRAVVTGCNTPAHANAAANDPQWGSFSLMVALFSDPESASAKDPMVVDPIEAMALDRRTGLYNFYKIESAAITGGKPVIKRIRLMPDGDVVVYERSAGDAAPRRAKAENRECNGCHVNMGPLMNEMHEPWTNWVSPRKTLPKETSLSGTTRAVVSEAVSLDGSHGRSSFANDLEKTMQSAIRVWVEGIPGSAGSGFVQANVDGDQPKRVRGLLKGVFCETELQYESAFEVMPLELFVDPGATQGGQVLRPAAHREDLFPILMPVRSEMDKRIELGLVKKRVLSLNTTLAVRLFDEDNDVFSSRRCALYPKVVLALPENATEIDKHVRSILVKEAENLPDGPLRTYASALLEDAPSLATARKSYLDATRLRLVAELAKLETAEGRDELKRRSQTRKDAAQKMFDGVKSPLPLLPAEKL